MGQIELNCQQAEVLVTWLAASLEVHCEDTTEVLGEREPLPEYPEGARGVEPELAAQGEIPSLHQLRDMNSSGDQTSSPSTS
jgi:hypothetical protein